MHKDLAKKLKDNRTFYNNQIEELSLKAAVKEKEIVRKYQEACAHPKESEVEYDTNTHKETKWVRVLCAHCTKFLREYQVPPLQE